MLKELIRGLKILMKNLKSILDNELQWQQVVSTNLCKGSEKWLTYLRLSLFEILEDESLNILEKLFDFAHFVVETASIGK